MKSYINLMEGCLRCGQCTAHCDFLCKYGLDHSLDNLERLKELSFHCFMCGECAAYCPKGIDGKVIMQMIREEQTRENHGNPVIGGYEKLLEEKIDYLYQNYRLGGYKSVLFMGCNFPAYFPNSTKKLSKLFLESYDIGTIYECCGKPVRELGLTKEAGESIQRIQQRLCENQIEELITVCPNCYLYLKDKVDVRVVSIYEKIKELQIGENIDDENPYFFQPCPDRMEGFWKESVQTFFTNEIQCIKDVQCCGLGGCAKSSEPEIANGFADKIRKKGYEKIYTYCASCTGNLRRNGCEHVWHLLPVILGFPQEDADIEHNRRNRENSKYW